MAALVATEVMEAMAVSELYLPMEATAETVATAAWVAPAAPARLQEPVG